MSESKKIVIIGGGAAGIFAAINAARLHRNNSYVLLEATQRLLTKVLISGGGRCNVTHHCFDPKLLVNNYPRGRKELIGAFNYFQPRDTWEWFKKEGVALKIEEDGRVFPVTNKSKTIADTLITAAQKSGVDIKKGQRVLNIEKNQERFIITLSNQSTILADKVMLATGSSPVGLAFAKNLGHTIVDTVPSLFTFNIKDPFLENLSGQSKEKVSLELSFDKKIERKSFVQTGPMLVTHWGLSGPAVLKLSAFAAVALFKSNYNASLKVNWLSDYNQDSCFKMLCDFRDSNMTKSVLLSPKINITKRLWAKFVDRYSGCLWSNMNNKSLRQLASELCSQVFKISGKGIFKEEFVTCGGVKRSEIDFRSMSSKKVANLYFAGEIIDIDGVTGGFNFQNAWTTAWIASKHLG